MDSRTQISQNNIGKEKLRGLSLFNFKDYCKAIVQCDLGIRTEFNIKE